MPVIQRRSLQSDGAPHTAFIPRKSSPTLFGFRIRRQPQSDQPLPEAGVPPVVEEESSDEDDAIISSASESDLEADSSAEDDASTVAGNTPTLQGNVATTGTAGTPAASATIDPAQPASNHLGVGPIIGIVFGVFGLLGVIALFFYRRRMIQRRKSMSGKWAIKPFAIGSPKDFRKGDDGMMAGTPSMVSTIAALPSPNLGRGSSPPFYLSKPPPGGTNRIAPDFKIVKRPFVPARPDELQVKCGDRLRVLNQYDDAWALCVNMSASLDADQDRKPGVVPIACWSEDDSATGGADAEENGGDDDKMLRLSRRESLWK